MRGFRSNRIQWTTFRSRARPWDARNIGIGFWRAAAEFDAFQAKCTPRLNAMEKAAERALEDAIEHAIENAAGIKREPDPGTRLQ
jgi:hypothetical protein